MTKSRAIGPIYKIGSTYEIADLVCHLKDLERTLDDPQETWVIGLEGAEAVLESARIIHFPGVEDPAFLVAITPASLHIYDYKSVEYAYTKKDG